MRYLYWLCKTCRLSNGGNLIGAESLESLQLEKDAETFQFEHRCRFCGNTHRYTVRDLLSLP
jgi:hypothetical protein